MKTTAAAVASELRILADALAVNPELEITRPTVYFYHGSEKGTFVELAKLLPRPLTKRVDPDTDAYPDFYLEHDTPGISLIATIRRSAICEIVEPARPAVYHCPPILSPEEEEQALANA
jgi:hypothetical protein